MTGVKPAMAYPGFASATFTFAPSAWPNARDAGVVFRRFEADARTAGGAFHRQTSPLTEKIIVIHYAELTAQDCDAFATPDGGGFYHAVGGEKFEYRHLDGNVYMVVFLGAVESSIGEKGWRALGPIVMAVAQ